MPRPRLLSTIAASATAAVVTLGAVLALGGAEGAVRSVEAASSSTPTSTESPPAARAARAARGPTDRRASTRFPTKRTAGVPRGWQPQRSVRGTVTVDRPGAVVENLRITDGDLVINAPDVTVRRVEILGGVIDNFAGRTCQTGLRVRASTIRRAPGQVTGSDEPAIGVGGYTARKVEILGLSEGFRVGGKDACGAVKIVGSYVRIDSPDVCEDWHGDALQGYDGGALTLRNSVLVLREDDGCGGTAPFFYPSDQGNTSVDIDGLVVEGGGYPFRLGQPGTVANLHIVQGSWSYGPIEVECAALSLWDADIVRMVAGQPVPVRKQRCTS